MILIVDSIHFFFLYWMQKKTVAQAAVFFVTRN